LWRKNRRIRNSFPTGTARRSLRSRRKNKNPRDASEHRVSPAILCRSHIPIYHDFRPGNQLGLHFYDSPCFFLRPLVYFPLVILVSSSRGSQSAVFLFSGNAKISTNLSLLESTLIEATTYYAHKVV
jgi:hypothetical protein